MGYFWKDYLKKDKIESVKESLFACISEQRSDCISKQSYSFARDMFDKRYVVLVQLKGLNNSCGNWIDITFIYVIR